jgi:hypothetical protein
MNPTNFERMTMHLLYGTTCRVAAMLSTMKTARLPPTVRPIADTSSKTERTAGLQPALSASKLQWPGGRGIN